MKSVVGISLLSQLIFPNGSYLRTGSKMSHPGKPRIPNFRIDKPRFEVEVFFGAQVEIVHQRVHIHGIQNKLWVA